MIQYFHNKVYHLLTQSHIFRFFASAEKLFVFFRHIFLFETLL